MKPTPFRLAFARYKHVARSRKCAAKWGGSDIADRRECS
jgi:hypothetical protein